MPIYFLFDFTNGDMAAIFVFDPHDNTVLAYSFGTVFFDLERSIQVTQSFNPNLFKIATELLLVMDRKSYIRFNLEPLSLTLSDIERSIQVTQVFNGLYLQIYSR